MVSRVTAPTDGNVAAERFPPFLPKEVKALEEEAAHTLAARIQRLPVKTSLSPDPIMTACVVPSNAGASPQPILLLHSFDGSLLEWRRIYPLLEAGRAEAWAVDSLGWGFSDTSSKISSFSAEAKREHLHEFWREHIRRPAVVVGPSLGGAAAIDFAISHPEAVAKLVLIDAQGFAEGVGNVSALPRMLAYLGVAVLRSVWLRSWAVRLAFKDPLLANSDAMRVGRLHCLMPGWADAMVSFMLSGGYNVAARIPQIRQKTLVIWGEDDQILDKSFATKFQEALPSLRLELIQDCGHIPHVEKPHAVAELLMAFASDLS